MAAQHNLSPRHANILQLVNENKRIQVNELSDHLKVSGVTIRQDLTLLDEQGLLKRVHGGAMSLQSDDLDMRLELNFELKAALAAQAASLVRPNETVLIEGGSANALLATTLAKRGDVSIITPSAYIANLIRGECENIILLGGVYQSQSESMVGPLTKLCIENIHFSSAFLGIDGYHPDTGFTSRDMMRAEIASTIIAKNKRNIVLTDSSKFGQIFPSSIGRTSDIAMLITDKDVSQNMLDAIQSKGVEVILGES